MFRQTQFAEFELRMHEMAEKGEPITGDALQALSRHHAASTTATTRGVCIVDDYVAHEWSYIPHFYRDFYVFQYATSFTAPRRCRRRCWPATQAATKRYLTFLGVGRIEVSDRSAEGRRRGHDDRRAARPDDQEDESRDGRDGEAARDARRSLGSGPQSIQ